MTRQIKDWQEVENIIFANYKLKEGIHGFSHIRRVVEHAKIIALYHFPELYDEIVLGAYLHDIGRTEDSYNETHGPDGAIIAQSLIEKYWPNVDSRKVCHAIETHTGTPTTDIPVAAAVRDADRLDIDRVGFKIDPDLLSTEKAKQILKNK